MSNAINPKMMTEESQLDMKKQELLNRQKEIEKILSGLNICDCRNIIRSVERNFTETAIFSPTS